MMDRQEQQRQFEQDAYEDEMMAFNDGRQAMPPHSRISAWV